VSALNDRVTFVIDKTGAKFLCHWLDHPKRLKCGKCLKGVLSSIRKRKPGFAVKCRVCYSKVEKTD
jgi:hypothetical protein